VSLAVFKVTLKTLTPLIVTKSEGFRGFIYTSLKHYLPGSTVQGAIFTSLINEGFISSKAAFELSSNDLINTLPALAIPNEGTYEYFRNVGIAHALCLKPKVCKDRGLVKCIDVGKSISKIVGGRLKELIRDEVSAIANSLGIHPSELSDFSGNVIVKVGGLWRDAGSLDMVRPKTYVSIAVKDWGGVEPGKLYAYEYIERGTKFITFISCVKDSETYKLLKDLESSGRVDVRIGRATSRGLGLTRLGIKECTLEELMGLGKGLGLNEVRDGDLVAFEVLSPTFILDPLPRPLKRGDVITDRLGLGLKADVLAVLVSKYGVGTYRGWSIYTNTPKLTVKGLPQGSLIITKIYAPKGIDLVSTLLSTTFLGISDIGNGFNTLLPLRKDIYAS